MARTAAAANPSTHQNWKKIAPLFAFLFLSLPITPWRWWTLVSADGLLRNASVDSPISPFLEDVVEAVAAKEGWDPETVRVSRLLEGRRAKVGRSESYEFHMRAGRRVLVFGLPGRVNAWKDLGGEGALGSESLAGSGCRRWAMKEFELEGPLELRAEGDGELSFLLPGNCSHSGMKKAIVGEGIKLKIKGALEVSILVPNDLRLLVNRSLIAGKEYKHMLWPQEYPSCRQLLAVYIQGSASIVASRILDSGVLIQTAFHHPEVLELLADKCYRRGYFNRRSPADILSLGSRMDLVGKILSSFLGYKMIKNEIPHFVKVKITSATSVKFWMEMVSEIDYGENNWNEEGQWKTKPRFERAQFEIIARVEDGQRLKPTTIKKLRGPFVATEVTALSNLFSNLSFSRFLSNVVPPEPLTLDAKW